MQVNIERSLGKLGREILGVGSGYSGSKKVLGMWWFGHITRHGFRLGHGGLGNMWRFLD